MIDVRNALLDSISEAIPASEKNIAVYLSGGIDSLSCVFALLELGKNVTTYSFTLEGSVSTDAIYAAGNSRLFNVPHKRFELSTNQESLKKDIRALAAHGAITKTDYECFWPFLKTLPLIPEKHIVTGHAADAFFGRTKKAQIHYKNRLQLYVDTCMDKPGYCQVPLFNAVTKATGQLVLMPYFSKQMRDTFRDSTYEQVNIRGKIKYPIQASYPKSFATTSIRQHTNLQMGDSGIQPLFASLLKSDWNTRNLKSVVGIFNDVRNGVI